MTFVKIHENKELKRLLLCCILFELFFTGYSAYLISKDRFNGSFNLTNASPNLKKVWHYGTTGVFVVSGTVSLPGTISVSTDGTATVPITFINLPKRKK